MKFSLKLFLSSALVGCFGTLILADVLVSDVNTRPEIESRTIRFRNHSIVVAEGGSGTNGFVGVKAFDFPEGRIKVHGCVSDISITWATNVIANGSGVNVALGTATAIATTGAVAHTSTRADILPNVEVDPFTNGVTKFNTALASSAQFDGTTTAKDIFLNVLVDDADISGAATGTVRGTFRVTFSYLGDY